MSTDTDEKKLLDKMMNMLIDQTSHNIFVHGAGFCQRCGELKKRCECKECFKDCEDCTCKE